MKKLLLLTLPGLLLLFSLAFVENASKSVATIEPCDLVYATTLNLTFASFASLHSAFRNSRTPERIRVWLLTDDERGTRARVDAFFAARFARAHLRVVPFAAHEFTFAASARRALDTPHNFVRFALHRLLPPRVRRALWLDADTLVSGDICALFDETRAQQQPVAAVLRASRTYFHMRARRVRGAGGAGKAATATLTRGDIDLFRRRALDARGKHLEDYYGKYDLSPSSLIVRRIPRLAACAAKQTAATARACVHFNAGVLLFRLDAWRARRMEQRVRYWIEQQRAHNAMISGSQPPLLLALYEAAAANASIAAPLDPRWHLSGLGGDYEALAREVAPLEPRRDFRVYHWSGRLKPWQPTATWHALYARYYVDDGRMCAFAAADSGDDEDATTVFCGTDEFQAALRRFDPLRSAVCDDSDGDNYTAAAAAGLLVLPTPPSVADAAQATPAAAYAGEPLACATRASALTEQLRPRAPYAPAARIARRLPVPPRCAFFVIDVDQDGDGVDDDVHRAMYDAYARGVVPVLLGRLAPPFLALLRRLYPRDSFVYVDAADAEAMRQAAFLIGDLAPHAARIRRDFHAWRDASGNDAFAVIRTVASSENVSRRSCIMKKY